MKAILLFFALPGFWSQDKKPPLEWNSHPASAVRKALSKQAPILVVFGSKTCPWCRRLQEETLQADAARPTLETKVLVYIDIDASPEIAKALGVHVVPDVHLYASDGTLLNRQAGFLAVKEFVEWVDGASRSRPQPEVPSLKSVRADPSIDAYYELEAEDKRPAPDQWEKLLALAAGPQGETRTEALRLVRLWARQSKPELVRALVHARLKVRLAAFDALSELGAPLDGLDPYAAPANQPPAKIEEWLRSSAPAPVSGWTPALERDLAHVEKSVHAAARERLVAAGPALVPRLRERAQSLRATEPAAASRLDEIRFRILLPSDLVRRYPDSSRRLADAHSGSRSQALEELLKLRVPELAPLVREALCDPDPLFRETAVAAARTVLGKESQTALIDRLKDPEPNVRTAALRELTHFSSKGVAKAIGEYLSQEKDPTLIGQAIAPLQEVRSKTSLSLLRSLLRSPHWSVRASAVKALTEARDVESLADIVPLLDDPDSFVVGQAVAAAARLADPIAPQDAAALVDALAQVADRRPDLISQVLRALSVSTLRKVKKTDAVLRRFTRHADGQVRAASVEALAKDPERPAYEEVRAGLDDPDPQVQSAAAAGLRDLIFSKEIHKIIRQNKRPSAYNECKPILESFVEKSPSERARLEAALTLIYFGDIERGKAVVLRALSGPDPMLREKSIPAIRWLFPEAAVQEAVDAGWGPATKEQRLEMLGALIRQEREVDSSAILLRLLPRVPLELRDEWMDGLAASLSPERNYNEELYQPHHARIAKRFREAAAEQEPEKSFLEAMILSTDASISEQEVRSKLTHPQAIVRRAALARLLREGTRLKAAEIEPLARDPEAQVRKLAILACMPRGYQSIFPDLRVDWVGGEGNASRTSWGRFSEPPAQVRVVPLPEPLLAERLADADADVRLRTALLMTMEGSEEALAYLHRWWREQPTYQNRHYLMLAIDLAWDDAFTPILEELYEALDEDDRYRVSELYQSIQKYKGQQVQRLRARIRKERSF